DIKALPAGPEEGVEAEVVVFRRGANMTLAEQFHSLLAYGLPVVAQRRKLGKARDADERTIWNRRKQIHQRGVWRHQRGMIRQLAQATVPDAAAIMHAYRRRDEDVQ